MRPMKPTHLDCVIGALRTSPVHIVMTAAVRSNEVRNPFSYQERRDLILKALSPEASTSQTLESAAPAASTNPDPKV